MLAFKKLLPPATASALFALAAGGLVFPPQIFAQSRIGLSELVGLTAHGSLRIVIEELADDRSLPTRFRVEADRDRAFAFELEGNAYAWRDVAEAASSGRVTLPDLEAISSWRVETLEDGAFRATLPLDSFYPAESIDPVPSMAVSDSLEPAAMTPRGIENAVIEALGYYMSSTRSIEAVFVGPVGEVLDLKVSLASPSDAQLTRFLGEEDGETSLAEKGWVIIVPLWKILVILGVTAITCAGLNAAAGYVCTVVCQREGGTVESFSSSWCGFSVSCTCKYDGGGTDDERSYDPLRDW